MNKFFFSVLLSVLTCQANAAMSYDVLLKPNHTETITNPMWWTLSGQCKIESSESLITLDISVDGKGSINGKQVSSGEKIQMNAHNGESFALIAEAGAKLNITKVNTPNQTDNKEVAIAHCHM